VTDIRVALIGFGYAGRAFHVPLISATPGLALTVIASRQSPSALSAYPAIEIVSDPLVAARHPEVDLVVVASPNDTHAPLAEAALRAGKHVVVDKPFTITLAQARALATTSAEVDRVLSVFQNRRWDSDFLGIAHALAGGSIGDVVEFRSEMSRYRPEIRDRWRERAGPGSGVWHDLGPHLIDQAIVLFGPPETVQADLQIQRKGGEATDWFQAVLGFGPMRVILVSSMMAADTPPRFLVRGTKGSLIKRLGDPQEAQLVSGQTPGSPDWGRDADPLIVITMDGTKEISVPAGDYLGYYAAIRDTIRGKRSPPVTPAQASTLMAIIEAGVRSSEESRVVRPDYTDAERSAWSPSKSS
jgi:predicted dehydrogenase